MNQTCFFRGIASIDELEIASVQSDKAIIHTAF